MSMPIWSSSSSGPTGMPNRTASRSTPRTGRPSRSPAAPPRRGTGTECGSRGTPGCPRPRPAPCRACGRAPPASRPSSSFVARPRTTSTRCIRWTGLKKCSPATRAGCGVVSASRETESAEVFDARTADAPSRSASWRKTSRFTSSRSTTASMTRSAPASGSHSLVAVTFRTSRVGCLAGQHALARGLRA